MPTRRPCHLLLLAAGVGLAGLIVLGVALGGLGRNAATAAAAWSDLSRLERPIRQEFTWLLSLPADQPVQPALLPREVGAAGYTFSKTVMLQALFDANGGDCTPSTEALVVDYGAAVVYCYVYTNIGSTRFITVSMVDDKLGAFGPIPFTQPLQPGGQNGFAAYGVIVTQTIINTAHSLLVDEFGTAVAQSDSALVSLGTPAIPTPTVTATTTPTHAPTATATPPFAHRAWLPLMIGGEAVTQNRLGTPTPTF